MNFLGLDQSLNHAGVAVVGPCNGFHAWTQGDEGLTGPARLDYWDRTLNGFVDQYAPRGVAIEGYAYGKLQASRSHSTGEAGGIARLVFWRRGIPVLIVPPNVLKSFATGVGNCDKSKVAVGLFKRWGYEVQTNDESDAGVLGLMAEARFGTPRSPLVQFQTKALTGCELIPGKRQEVRSRLRPVQQVSQNGLT